MLNNFAPIFLLFFFTFLVTTVSLFGITTGELLKYNISAYVDDFSIFDQGYSGKIIEDNEQIRQIAFLLL